MELAQLEKLLVIDLSENELAKIHIKHMVGGRAPKETIEKGESIFRVEERSILTIPFGVILLILN